MEISASKKVSPVLFHAILTLCIALVVVFILSCFIVTMAGNGMNMEGVAAHGMLSDHDTQKSHDHHMAIATLWQQEWASGFAVLAFGLNIFYAAFSLSYLLIRTSYWFRFRKRWRIGSLDTFLQRLFQQGILHPKTF